MLDGIRLLRWLKYEGWLEFKMGTLSVKVVTFSGLISRYRPQVTAAAIMVVLMVEQITRFHSLCMLLSLLKLDRVTMIERAMMGRLMHLKTLMKTSEIISPTFSRKEIFARPLKRPSKIAAKYIITNL